MFRIAILLLALPIIASGSERCPNLVQVQEPDLDPSDPILKYLVAVYVRDQFVCSGVVGPHNTIRTGASCLTECPTFLFVPYTSYIPANDVKVVIGQRVVTPVLAPEANFLTVDRMATEASFSKCHSSGQNTAVIYFDGKGKTYDHPPIQNVPLPLFANLKVYGWASSTGAAHCSVNINTLQIRNQQGCPPIEDEICTIYANYPVCTADTGSPVFHVSDAGEARIFGLVTNLFGKACSPERGGDFVTVRNVTEIDREQ